MTAEIERLTAKLKKKGWKVQKAGMFYTNGTLATSLFKDGEVLSIQQDIYPDEEFIEEQWPEESKEL